MSSLRRFLPTHPSLERLRKEAKDLLREARGGDAGASARIAATSHASQGAPLMLAHAQRAI